MLFHISENPNIEVFRPISPKTDPDADAVVWAVEEAHVPAYWFPKECPRLCCWRESNQPLNGVAQQLLGEVGMRLHAIEERWYSRFRLCRLFVYRFAQEGFTLQLREAGYWTARTEVRPLSVTPLGNLVTKHSVEGILLRAEPDLRILIEMVARSGLKYAVLKKKNISTSTRSVYADPSPAIDQIS